MHRVVLSLLAVSICLAVGLSGMAGRVAAAPVGPAIAPTYIDQKIKPGNSYNGTVSVANRTPAPFTYSVYAAPYTVYDENYTPYFSPIKGAINPADWFSFGKQGGSLTNGQDDTIPFKITVPARIGAGSYFATIFAETAQHQGGSGIITRERVGTIVYIEVLGHTIQSGNVDSWNVPWLQSPDLHGTLRLADTGSIYTRSQEKIIVSDAFGGTKYTFERTYLLLPQKIRRIDFAWPRGATFGLFKVTGTTAIFKTTPLPTRYVFVATPSMRAVILSVIIAFLALIFFAGKRTMRTPKQKREAMPYNEDSPKKGHQDT